MDTWKRVWRYGFQPQYKTPALLALREALRSDDDRLTQGSTTTPPSFACVQDWPCEGACITGYAGWQGEGLETVGEVEAYFAKTCFEADKRLGEPGGCRYFLNWFDDTPRDEMRRELLAEIDIELEAREEDLSEAPPMETDAAELDRISVPF